MIPHLHINLLKRRISSFHFFGVLGYIGGALLGTLIAKPLGLRPEIILLLATTAAGTFFLLAFAAKWLTGQESIVYYHHEIAILSVCSVLLYILGHPVLPYLDVTLLGIGTFLAFGRIGCFSVGCCHGRPHKHGVKYGAAHVQAGFAWYYKDVPLLPVQLIESGYVFLIVIAGTILLFIHVPPGTVLIVYTVVYGFFRFVLEFFRGDPDRPAFHGITEAQFTTLSLTGMTFVMGKINWLPEYNWHVLLFLAMIASTGLTILYYHKYPDHKLLSPQRLRELADGLNALEEVNNNTTTANTINVYTTKNGLSLSCGNTKNGVKHYTLSTKNKKILKPSTAKKIAEQIKLLNHFNQFELVAKHNNIFHIIFSETSTGGLS